MIYRILFCAGMALLAYYIGHEVGRTESIREQMNAARSRRAGPEPRGGDELPGS